MTVGTNFDVVLAKTADDIWDFTLDSSGDIKTEDFFDTALLMSIFAERRASATEVPESTKRRGWIGNESNENGFEIGSKLWLFEQARLTRDTLNGMTSAVTDGLQWFIDRAFLVSITVDTVLINGVVTLQIDLFRPNSKTDRRFFDLWNASGVTEN